MIGGFSGRVNREFRTVKGDIYSRKLRICSTQIYWLRSSLEFHFRAFEQGIGQPLEQDFVVQIGDADSQQRFTLRN